VVYEASAKSNAELSPADVYRLFEQTYINSSPVKLIGYREKTNGGSHVEAAVEKDQTEFNIEGSGNGVLDAFCNALRKELGIDFEIVYYTEHSLESGAGAQAITYVEISSGGKTFFGAGISSNIIKSSMRAVTSAVNNSIKSS
ncbi:MAG: 2-isopropylmalate synthase, partial [Defluviitaleaceae bacterium]|nr:2-isopropylmalate synthase [Defluviitaleaceae bacterium]